MPVPRLEMLTDSGRPSKLPAWLAASNLTTLMSCGVSSKPVSADSAAVWNW